MQQHCGSPLVPIGHSVVFSFCPIRDVFFFFFFFFLSLFRSLVCLVCFFFIGLVWFVCLFVFVLTPLLLLIYCLQN